MKSKNKLFLIIAVILLVSVFVLLANQNICIYLQPENILNNLTQPDKCTVQGYKYCFKPF